MARRHQGRTLVRVEGGRELRRRLKTVENGLGRLKAGHRWVADFVLGWSGRDAPRRTGRLASNGRASGTNTASIVRYGGARVPYAGPIHYGWPARHIQPHEWVISAAQRSEGVWLPYFNSVIEELVEETPGS